MDHCFDSSSERAAVTLVSALAGERPKDHETGRLLRQLRNRIESWVSLHPPAAATWSLILEAPRKGLPQLADLLAQLVKDDVVARHLVERLAPPDSCPLPTRISYRDFIVAIEGSEDGVGLFARLLETPYGERCRVPVDLSFCQGNSRALVRFLDRQLRNSRDTRRRHSSAAPAFSPDNLGRDLFRALFHDRLLEAWAGCMGLLAGRPDLGVRLRLVFDLKHSGLCAVAALPWELLRDPATNQLLCKNVRTPLVRSLETVGAGIDPIFQGRPSILVVQSQPKDQLELAVASESRAIEEAWRSVPGVLVENAVADLAGLRNLLRSRSFEVFHFLGHGDFDRNFQEGLLLFEDGTGRTLKVPAATLVEQLSGIPLELVVLSSCRSGELPRVAGVEPFSGVASALVKAGIPAVLAMQFPISDDAAVTFGRELYRRLAIGDTIEAAVTEGRLAISRCNSESLEWLTPVLYLPR